jgi:hypothetical protein
LEDFVRTHQQQFTGMDEALRDFPPQQFRLDQAASQWLRVLKIRLRREGKN